MNDSTKDLIPRRAIEYCLRKETVSTNPDEYESHEKFIAFLHDQEISEFGAWMHSNGFNCALTAVKCDLDKIPSAQEQKNERIFKGIVVEYPSISTYPEYEGKPYFSIKYTEDGQDFIGYGTYKPDVLSEYLKEYFMTSAQPERLTDDDFETIRIHLNAFKEKLCNQRRWKEAEEYQRIIDRFMAFASAQPENMRVNLDIQKITTHKSDFSDLDELPSVQPDYTEMKQEFLRMASYIDVLLECSDEQKETLMGFISRLAEYMPWTERD